MAPSFVQAHTGAAATADSLTLGNFDVGSGTDRTLVVVVHIYDQATATAPTISGITFNGTALTQRVRSLYSWSSGTWHNICEIWTLDNPANTTADVVISFSAAVDDVQAHALEYTGANNGIGSNTGTVGANTASPSISITTEEDTSLIVGAIHVAGGANSWTPGAGITERVDLGAEDITGFSGDKAASAGSDTFAATQSGGNRCSGAAIELLAAAEAPAAYTMPPPTIARRIQHMLVR